MTEFERKLLRQNDELIAGQNTLIELLRNSLSKSDMANIPLSTEEVEARFGVSRKTLTRKCKAGEITAHYLGNHAFYYLSDLLKLKPKDR